MGFAWGRERGKKGEGEEGEGGRGEEREGRKEYKKKIV